MVKNDASSKTRHSYFSQQNKNTLSRVQTEGQCGHFLISAEPNSHCTLVLTLTLMFGVNDAVETNVFLSMLASMRESTLTPGVNGTLKHNNLN